MTQEIALLQTLTQAFPGIPKTEVQELIASGEVKTYSVNTILCHEDAFEDTFYVILDGKVRVTKKIDRNETRLLTELDAGDFFGEMALIHDAPRAATVTTIVPTRVLEINKKAFNNLLQNSASVSIAMVQEVSRRLRENDAMAIEDLRIKAGELASAYQQLAEQEYARREFLTAIAHELRTPLTAAGGFLQMIETGLIQGKRLDSEVQEAAIKSASRNIQHIVSLVNDILFIQEMDLILPRFEPTDLYKVLEKVVKDCQEKVYDVKVEIRLNPDRELSKVSGDAESLGRAFSAILDNAIKFSHEGGVVEVNLEQFQTQVLVSVQDHGIGIPNEYKSRIFDRFFHVDQLGERMFRGLGLGLSIARQVIEQHDGKIKVDSEYGKGTTVSVFLNSISDE